MMELVTDLIKMIPEDIMGTPIETIFVLVTFSGMMFKAALLGRRI